MARNLPPDAKLVCVEANPECVKAMRGVLKHAGDEIAVKCNLILCAVDTEELTVACLIRSRAELCIKLPLCWSQACSTE